MAIYFEKPSNPEFSEQVERFETTEPGHADTFNKRVEQLFHNELALRKAIEGVYQQASGYTDAAIAKLIGGAPSTLDTLREIADAIEENQDVVEALDAAIGSKASEQEFEAHRVNSNIHVTADEKERLAEIYNTYQKKNAVDGINYNELYLARTYILESDLMYLAGTLNLGNNINVSCKVSTYSADIDIIQEEIICISWNSGEGSVMCENGAGMSLGQIPVICMYKNGMYCINVMEVLKQAATFAFSRMFFLNMGGNCYIFSEKIAGAHGAVANLMKQIGSTPLGFGNGTLTGAISELHKTTMLSRLVMSVTTNEFGISAIGLSVNNIAVVSAYSEDSTADIIIPFAVGEQWWIKALTWNNNAPVVNKTIHITCLYFNI